MRIVKSYWGREVLLISIAFFLFLFLTASFYVTFQKEASLQRILSEKTGSLFSLKTKESFAGLVRIFSSRKESGTEKAEGNLFDFSVSSHVFHSLVTFITIVGILSVMMIFSLTAFAKHI